MDNLEVGYIAAGESKNCYIYEPEEGAETMGKIYIRKSAVTGQPARILVTFTDADE